jgi:glucokinase
MPAVIAADLGGTFLRTACVTPERIVLQEAVRRVEDRRGNAAVAAFLRAALQEAYHRAREASLDPIAVGLAVPGLVDPAAGMLRYSGNLDVRDLPVEEAVREAVPLPFVVENDVRAAAWGEWLRGAGQSAVHMTYLSAGTGIAAAAVFDGHLYYGATDAAGELGHAPVIPDGDLCRCGRRGCLETVAGGWGIARRAGMATAEDVFEAAAAGDAAAGAVIEEAGRALGQAAITVVRLWNPDRVILGGGLFHEGSPLVDAVREAIAGSPLRGDALPVVGRGQFGEHSGLMGAACLALAIQADA